MPFEGTVDIAVLLTVRSILLDTATHEPVPTNSGLFRPIRITAPEGTLANPRFPAPVIARFCSGNAVADTVMRALSQVVPDNVSAGIGHLKVTAFSGLRDGTHWVYMDIMEGSYGGRLGKDGLDAVDTLYANTRNNPIEDIESHYPLRVTRYELTEGTGGRGRWRGGLGSIREFEFTEPGGFSIEGDGSKFPPPGLFGGADGTPGSGAVESRAPSASSCCLRSCPTARRRRASGCAWSGPREGATATRRSGIRKRPARTCSTAMQERSEMRILVISLRDGSTKRKTSHYSLTGLIHSPLLAGRFATNFFSMRQFFQDAEEGELSPMPYSFTQSTTPSDADPARNHRNRHSSRPPARSGGGVHAPR